MSPISDNDIDKYRYILMYDDETVIDAVRELRDQEGYDWWHLVVDLDGGAYAVSRFADLSGQVVEKSAEFLERQLGDLVGAPLVRVEVVADQDQSDLASVRKKTADSKSQVAVIAKGGQFRGIIPVGGKRSVTKGSFDEGLVQLAGRHAKIPKEGVLSRRRMAARKREGKSSSRPANK